MKAAVFSLPERTTPPGRRPYAEHPTAGPKTHQKRKKRAPEAGNTLADRPDVLPTPARDGGGEIWVIYPTLQTCFSFNFFHEVE